MILEPLNWDGNYYTHPFVSNSDLSRLQKSLLAPAEELEYMDALKFGTLVHALILEPETFDHYTRQVVGAPAYEYTAVDVAIARKMRDAFLADDFCRSMLATCAVEYAMYNPSTKFAWNGVEFELDTRRKYDLWNQLVKWGADIKSTTATTESAFRTAINRFDYDRGRVFYAAGSGAKRDAIIGISKINYKVFKVFLAEGSELWRSGTDKMNEIAFKYWATMPVTY